MRAIPRFVLRLGVGCYGRACLRLPLTAMRAQSILPTAGLHGAAGMVEGESMKWGRKHATSAFEVVQADEPRVFRDPVTLATFYRNTRHSGWYATVRRSWGQWFVRFYGTGRDFEQRFDREAQADKAARAYAMGSCVHDSIRAGQAVAS